MRDHRTLLSLYVPIMNLLDKNLLTTPEVPTRPAASLVWLPRPSELWKILVARKVTEGSSTDIATPRGNVC